MRCSPGMTFVSASTGAQRLWAPVRDPQESAGTADIETMPKRKFLVLYAILTSLGGCAVEKYELPPGAPYAEVKSRLQSGASRHDSIRIAVGEAGCGTPSAKLAIKVRHSGPIPKTSVRIAANRPVAFYYADGRSAGSLGHAVCSQTHLVVLDEGQTYTLHGGAKFEPGKSFPMACTFSIRNDRTGEEPRRAHNLCAKSGQVLLPE